MNNQEKEKEKEEEKSRIIPRKKITPRKKKAVEESRIIPRKKITPRKKIIPPKKKKAEAAEEENKNLRKKAFSLLTLAAVLSKADLETAAVVSETAKALDSDNKN